MFKLRSSHHVVGALALVWMLLFVYHEHVAPARGAAQCAWADVAPAQTNVLLVADPQLIDNHTYPGRNAPLLRLSQHTVDVYLRQNYRALVRRLAPDYIVFLGDYLDNGRLVDDAYFAREFARFERIFGVPGYVRLRPL